MPNTEAESSQARARSLPRTSAASAVMVSATTVRDTGIITDDDLLRPSLDEEKLQEIESLEVQCLNEVNRLRQSHRLVPLTFSENLLYVARSYSRRMAEEKFFSHSDPEGRSVRERVNEANIKWRMVGENLALSNGYINPVAISLRGWMDSPGHRRNLARSRLATYCNRRLDQRRRNGLLYRDISYTIGEQLRIKN